MAKGKKEKQSILSSPQVFFILGIIDFIFFCLVFNGIIIAWPHPNTEYSGLNISLPFLLLLLESVVFIGYSIRLMIARQNNVKISFREYKIINVVLAIIFIIGLYYAGLIITGHSWWIRAVPQNPIPGQIPVPNI